MSQPHRARRLALQALCCLDVQGPKVLDLVGEFIEDSDEPPRVLALAREMMSGALASREECDKLLARNARRWDLPRAVRSSGTRPGMAALLGAATSWFLRP